MLYDFSINCHVRIINTAGPDGIQKIIKLFVEKHPSIPKRQVEIKINEVAIKDQGPGPEDKIKVNKLVSYKNK